MKRALSILFLATIALFGTCMPAFASSSKASTTQQVKVSARIGEFYLSLSGIIAPYASVSLLSDGNVYRATVADSKGSFTFSNILINRGFSSLCLDAIDWRKVGESYTCIQLDPATKNVAMDNIFLPPTLGLDHKEISEGGSVILSGYSMPGAQVIMYIGDTKQVLGTADSTGYYHYTLKEVKKGSYELYAGANYQERASLLPTRKLLLKALATGEYFIGLIRNLLTWIADHGYVFIIPILLILLVAVTLLILFYDKIMVFLRIRNKDLHHAWFVGY